jgi:hypothetical protein
MCAEGATHTSPEHRPGNRIREKARVLKKHRIGWAGVDLRDTVNMRRSFRTRVCFARWIPRVGTLGWYAMPYQGMGIGNAMGPEIDSNGDNPQSQTPTHSSAKSDSTTPIADTHSFIRQVGDKSGWLPSSHAERGLGVPGSAEPQLGVCSQNSATAT